MCGTTCFIILEFLGHEFRQNHRQPCDIAARAGKACHVANAHRIGVSGKHYGDRLGRPARGLHLGGRRREDGVDFQPDQLGCPLRQLFGRCRPSELDHEVSAFDIAEFSQTSP